MATVAKNKEESRALRVEYSRIPLKSEDHRRWMRFVKIEGKEVITYAQPFVVRKLSEEEHKRREKALKELKESREKAREQRKQKKSKELEQHKALQEAKSKKRMAKLEEKLALLRSK